MAFKMKRAGMSLRSTTRVAPQLTQYQSSSPINQGENPPEKKQRDSIEVNDTGNVEITGVNVNDTTGGSTERPNNPDFKPNAEGTNLACTEARRKKFFPNDPEGFEADCNRYKKSTITCNDGSEPTIDANGDPTCPEGETRDEGSVTGNYTSPGQMQPLTHILNPREMRRNNRMLRIGSDGDERSIKKANKNIRQAIRRGQEPSENDLAIISGQALGNYDGLNMKQDSSGYRDWFTGQQYRSVQTNPGGEMGEGKNYNDLVRSAAKDLYAADPSKYPDEASLLAAAEKATIQARTDGDGSDPRVAGGKYLSRRTRKLMEDRNVDTSRFGTYGQKGKSKRKRDYDKRKVKKYNNELKSVQSAFDADGNFDRKKAGMSKRKYDKLKRKSEARGGDVSAFKKKDSPIHMTVNVTKPSYKMGGFGSK